MATATRTLMAAMMMVAGSTQLVSAQDAQLTVHVRNDANVPTDVLASAQLSLMAIYANAGIQVSLVEKDADFLVVLLETAHWMHKIPDALGIAVGTETGGRIAYVLHHRVTGIARGYRAPASVVLGSAIAHELGHLLMVNAHAAAGIMRATWNQADFREASHGNLLFTPAQGAKMRLRLSGVAQQSALAR